MKVAVRVGRQRGGRRMGLNRVALTIRPQSKQSGKGAAKAVGAKRSIDLRRNASRARTIHFSGFPLDPQAGEKE